MPPAAANAHVGRGMVYLGDKLAPTEYRNGLFTCNLHGSRGQSRTCLKPHGSGYVANARQGIFLFANDPWVSAAPRHSVRPRRRRFHLRLDRHRRVPQLRRKSRIARMAEIYKITYGDVKYTPTDSRQAERREPRQAPAATRMNGRLRHARPSAAKNAPRPANWRRKPSRRC